MEWLQPNERRPERPASSRAARKLMLTVFFDTRGLIYHEFLDPGTTITGAVYRNTLSDFIAAMETARPDLWADRWRWRPLQDNAPVHTSGLVTAHLDAELIETILHPPLVLI